MFTPIRTERLVIRQFATADADGLAARRNDPEVARYQDWALPYTLEQAKSVVSSLEAMEGPADGEWWMAVVSDTETGAVVGDLAVELT